VNQKKATAIQNQYIFEFFMLDVPVLSLLNMRQLLEQFFSIWQID
jgi:hypothetical protein